MDAFIVFIGWVATILLSIAVIMYAYSMGAELYDHLVDVQTKIKKIERQKEQIRSLKEGLSKLIDYYGDYKTYNDPDMMDYTLADKVARAVKYNTETKEFRE